MSLRDLVYRNPLTASVLSAAEALVHRRRYGHDRLDLTADPKTQEVVEAIRRDGVAVVPNFLDPDTCEGICDSIDRAIEVSPETAWVDPQGADHRLFGFERVNSDAYSFFVDDWLHRLGCAVAGCDLINLFTLAGRISAVDGNLGSGGGWHRDSYARQFKAILYLTDVDEEAGPFQFVEGTAGRASMIREVWRGLSFRQTRIDDHTAARVSKKSKRLRTFTAPAGTLILADTRGIHRGMPIREGSRYALTNYYFAKCDVTQERIAHFNDNVPFADGKPLSLADALAFQPVDASPEHEHA